MTRPVAGSMQDVQERLALAVNRRERARAHSRAGDIEWAMRLWTLAEAMFESAGERFMHGQEFDK